MKKVIVAALGLLLLTAQAGAGEENKKKEWPPVTIEPGKIEQKEVCVTYDESSPKKKDCTPGQKIYFFDRQNARMQIGSNQSATASELELKFVSLHCDFNYPVTVTPYGVVCIFMPCDHYREVDASL